MVRAPRKRESGNGFTQPMNVEDFQKRQEADRSRYNDIDGECVVRRRPFHERLKTVARSSQSDVYDRDETAVLTDDEGSGSGEGEEETANRRDYHDQDVGEEAWRNREGERLADFGVDEIADFYDEEEDIPLSELMRRRKAEQS